MSAKTNGQQGFFNLGPEIEIEEIEKENDEVTDYKIFFAENAHTMEEIGKLFLDAALKGDARKFDMLTKAITVLVSQGYQMLNTTLKARKNKMI